jgi:putative transposase
MGRCQGRYCGALIVDLIARGRDAPVDELSFFAPRMPFKPVPRLTSFDYVGPHRYFLTFCTSSRSRAFVTDVAVACVMTQLQRTAADCTFAVVAYCYMPDHLHLLVEGSRADASLTEFVRVFKQRSSFHWKRRFGNDLWQRSYFEHVLRDDEATVSVAQYVLENPLRAGLSRRVEDYPYLGSQTMMLKDLLYSVCDDR